MTEINFLPPAKNKSAGRRATRNIAGIGIRIDMTPMVDLGFLLITFFIFTTEISKPAITKLYMPHDGDVTPIPDSKSLTILLSSSDQIFYYFGREEKAIENEQVYRTTFDEINGVGRIIRQKQMDLEHRHFDKKELIVLIKPGSESSYKNVVAALDEMLINGVSRYAVLDLSREESAFLIHSEQHRPY